MADEYAAQIAVLQAENQALRNEINRLHEELRQAREDADAAEARGYLLSQQY